MTRGSRGGKGLQITTLCDQTTRPRDAGLTWDQVSGLWMTASGAGADRPRDKSELIGCLLQKNPETDGTGLRGKGNRP